MNVNVETFNKPDKYAAYLLGLLWADGYINTKSTAKGNKFRISLELVESDFIDIENTVLKTGKWCIYKRFHSSYDGCNRKLQCSAITSNMELHKFFIDNQYGTKSLSKISILNSLSKENQKYWMRGYFDGDGCIYKYPNKNSFQLIFAGSYNQDWSEHLKWLKNNGISRAYVKQKMQKNNTQKFSILMIAYQEDIKSFFNIIYKNRYDGIGFTRKYNKSRLIYNV